ncbi:MAG: hypothetical protein E7338_02650 [Clostridiales bacterium]|nr:hypothetical protein [Clostridiales bacterium]
MADEKNLNEEIKTEEEKEVAPEVQEEPTVEEAPIDTPVENKEEEQKQEEAPSIPDAPKDEAPTIIDNTAEPPVAPIQELPRTAKLKEPMSKQKKIAIIVISVVAFIALFSVVFFPLYFCYIQGRIHVYDASDFVPQDGKRFVLEKDIVVDADLDLSSSTCSIDLQGHNLTVNGTLTIGKNDTTIQVGTLKKGDYTQKGLLKVGTLNVNGESGALNIASSLIVSSALNVNAKSVNLNTVTLTGGATITAESFVVNGPFAVSSDTTTLTLNNCAQAIFNDEVGANVISINDSNVVLNAKVKANNLVLNDASSLVCHGEVKSINGGKKVAMMKGHNCPTYENVNILAIYDAFNDTYTATNCAKIVYLETLPTPVDFFVSEEGGVFQAICAKVDKYDAIKYRFFLDAKQYEDSIYNYVDITSDLKAAGAATHKLQAYALGNYDFATLETQTLENGQTLYLDCETPATLDYSYTLKLSTPTKVSTRDYELNAYIEFDSVEFADYYVVTIDKDTKVVLTNLTRDEFLAQYASIASQYGNNVVQYTSQFGHNAAPLTSQLSALGFHSLRLVACSFASEIETSKEAMTSYKTTKQIVLVDSNVTATSKQNNDGTYTNTVSIANCEDGKVFVITIDGKDIRISNSKTYTFITDSSMVGEKVTVKAEAYGYYTESASQTVDFQA